MFLDSEEDATPEIQLPQTTAGTFLNSLVADFPENFEKQVNLFELDRFITTADLEQTSWMYVCFDVPASLSRVLGDGIPLSRVDSIVDLYESVENDYCYYYSGIDRQVITKKLFKVLSVDLITYEQVPTLKWNWFDEFGARVGLQRLYLESNDSFKKRILDVYKNLPGPTVDAVKRTLRRELNIWAAYGATPDSDYVGATPEIIEIQDMESSSPYFDYSGKPTEKFRDFVRTINEKYPTNWGYVKWGEGFWDYAGKDQLGIGRIPAVYDDATPLGGYYQPGVGDFNDAYLVVKEPHEAYIDVDSTFKAYGTKYVGKVDSYSPIRVDYEYYGSYAQDYYSNQNATVNFRYILTVPAHGSYATAKDFYVDVAAYPSNKYYPGHPSSPEFNLVNIFDQDGYAYSEYVFKDLQTNQAYSNTSVSPTVTRINYYHASKASATPTSGSSNFRMQFLASTPSTSVIGTPMNLPSFAFGTSGPNIRLVSNVYNKYRGIFETTPRISNSFVLNSVNSLSELKDFVLDKNFITNTLLFPPGATPQYVHITNTKPVGYEQYSDFYQSTAYSGYGGLSSNIGLDYYVPSSPNIIASYVNPNFATPTQHFGYISTTGGSTVNYYFVDLKYPYNATPDNIVFSTGLSSTPVYPFKIDKWETFVEESTPMIQGVVSKDGVIRHDPDNWDETFTKNSTLLGKYNLSYETFGLNHETDYIYHIEPSNDTDGVNLISSTKYISVDGEEGNWRINTLKESSDGNIAEVEVNAEYTGTYKTYLNSGWYSHDEQDYYVYSNPVTEYFATPGFFVKLSNVARQGAPIVVDRLLATPMQLQEVAFYNESTPTHIFLYNTETVLGNRSDNLYLGYNDIYDVTVTDLVTGYTVLQNGYSSTNELEAFSSATPSVPGREYEVTYRVRNTYSVDNDYWDSSLGKYVTRVDFDATPNQTYAYNVTYESDLVSHATPLNIVVDPMELWDQEGFIYLSHNDYNFADFSTKLNPSYIVDNTNEYMVLTVISLDVNGNPKPYQTFTVSGSGVLADENYYTTDINGFAAATLHYNGSVPSSSVGGSFSVLGVTNGSANAHPNSQTQGFSKTINYSISSAYDDSLKLKAKPSNTIITADGFSNNYITGKLSLNNLPQKSKVIYWRKGRNLYDLFAATPYQDYVRTDTGGNFTVGPITAADRSNPGIWILAVETENAATVNSNPVNIAGDIVYWYEKYDNLNYQYGGSVLYNPNVLYDLRPEMSSTPTFTVNYFDGNYATPYTSTPNWLPPRWYPINRIDQHGMGLLGSTPYYVSTYTKIMNEYEED